MGTTQSTKGIRPLQSQKALQSVFVSHSSGDKNFVNLFSALLEYHGIETWYSVTSLSAGDQFRDEILTALEKCDALLVICTDKAADSKWVLKEIVAFRVRRPESPIIPVRLGPPPAEEYLGELRDFHWVDFSEDMLDGFRKLFSRFGREFLPHRPVVTRERRSGERRGGDDRREKTDRRNPSDRRKAPILQRMRLGFWKAFENVTGVGEFEPLNFTVRTKFKVVDALRDEVARYEVRDGAGRMMKGEEVVEAAINLVWKDLASRQIVKAVYIIEAIAEEIYHSYEVTPLTRRKSERRDGDRRSESERREH